MEHQWLIRSVCSVLLVLCLPCLATPVRFGAAVTDPIPPKQAPALFEQMRTLGIAGVRIRADWPRLQPAKGQWNFAWLDAQLAEARQRGLEVTLVFGPSPAWTVSYLTDPQPDELQRALPDPAELQTYVRAVVQRYQKQVRYYQIWERPSPTSLLAEPDAVYHLYAVVARAVHGVNANLQVIAPEPGDLDLCWIANYLHAARGADRADILQLAPSRHTLRPETVWWRLPALRQRVLPPKSPPLLWAEVEMTFPPADLFATTAALLLSGVSDIRFTFPATATEHPLSDETARGIRALSSLQGFTPAGWTLLADDVPAGIFQKGRSAPLLLVMPLRVGDLLFVPAEKPLLRDGVAVPGGSIGITPLGSTETDVVVTAQQRYPLAKHPFLLSGVRVLATPGTPEILLDLNPRREVSLDISGEDRASIRPLFGLPGGCEQVSHLNGVMLLATVAGTGPWLHFDIPDNFIFYNTKGIPVEVTCEVLGVQEAEKTGFNLYYDSVSGMKYSPWQWIDIGPDKRYRYTFRLNDALFANRQGFDLRVNMGGSRENIRLTNITVRKVDAVQ